MKANCVYENLEFERGQDPKKSLNIGRESRIVREFYSTYDAAEWAVRNLEWITDDKYSPDEPIRRNSPHVIPEDLSDYIIKWAKTVSIIDPHDNNSYPVIHYAGILSSFIDQLSRHGILIRENLNFKRGQKPYKAIGIGKHRLVKKGEPIEISYKGEKIQCIALDDEEDDTTPDGSGRRFIDFEDEDGDRCWAVRDYHTGEWIVPSVNESVNFEKSKNPYKSLQIGREAKIEKQLQDDDFIEDMIDEIDHQLGTVMVLYLSLKKSKKLIKRWLSDSYEWKSLRQSDEDEEVNYDEEDKIIEPKINYELADLEAEGWEVFNTENNFGQIEVILCRKK